MIPVECPRCRLSYPVGPEWAGRHFLCRCGEVVAVPVQLDKLIAWDQREEEGVKHFSGTATYAKQINVDPALIGENKSVYLDLGEVKNLAQVTVNGQDVVTLWKPPFRADITKFVKPGANELRVKVTNLWPNRLIGDAGLPPEQRTTWTAYDTYKKESPLLPSGLIGPVKLIPTVTVPVAAN